jgi:hypothetical protein
MDQTYLVESKSTVNKPVYEYSMDTIQDFIFNGFDYALPEMVKNIINRLAEKVGSPDYIKTPIFKKRKDFNNQDDDKNDWSSIRSFNKTVVIEEERNVNEIVISEMKKQMNKMTEDNYVVIRDKIFEVLYNHNVDDNKCMDEINEAIFTISSSNAFFADVYARFMKDMMEKYPSMRAVFEKHLDNVMSTFDNIRYVNPDDNYDEFCRVNKENDVRRALVGFFVHLCIVEILSVDKIVDIFYKLYELINVDRKTKGNVNKVEEVVNTIYALINSSLGFIKSHEKYQDIEEKVREIADSDKKLNPGLSNKAIFKMLDLVDAIEKS